MESDWAEKFYSQGLLTSYSKEQIDMLKNDAPVEFFQYRSDEERNIKNLEEGIIWASAIRCVNDPFDCDFNISELDRFEMEYNHDIINDLRKRTINLKEELAISCFSEKNNSILMWSHYANKHKGFCACYRLIDIFCANKILLPVWYRKEKVLPFSDGDMLEINPRIKEIIIQKSYEWSYEKEWRIVDFLNDKTEVGLTIKIKPTRIIIGACATEDTKRRLKQIGKEKEIAVTKMYLENGEFKLTENW